MDLKAIMADLTQPNSPGTTASLNVPLPQPAAAAGDILTIDMVAAMLNHLLDKTAAALGEQEALLRSLPPAVRDAASQILSRSLPDGDTLKTGLAALLHSRQHTVDGLLQLADKLQTAANAGSAKDEAFALPAEREQPRQQATVSLTQGSAAASGSFLSPQQAREQSRAALPDLLPQQSAATEGKQPAPTPSLPPAIAEAAVKLDLPELVQIWQLADGATEAGVAIAAAPLKPTGSQPAAPETAERLPVTGLSGKPEPLPPAAPPQASQPRLQPDLPTTLNQFRQQAAAMLAELPAGEADPALLQQVRAQILSSMPELLRQAVSRQAVQQTAAPTAEQLLSAAAAAPPAVLRQPIEQLAMPELLDRWPSDREMAERLAKTAPQQLEQSAVTVRLLAESVNRAFQTTSDDQGKAVLFNLQMPFNADPAQSQPVHIHIFHEKRHKSNADWKNKPDTWVRLTVQPEHTGQVDTVFHLYGENILDIKVIFANKEASLLFTETVPVIREACGKFPFLLGDISVV